MNDLSPDRCRGQVQNCNARASYRLIHTTMKTFLLCLSCASVLALALVANGASPDCGDFVALGFVSALTSWFLLSDRRKSSFPEKAPGGSSRRKTA